MAVSLHPRDVRAAFRDGGLQIAYQAQWDLGETRHGDVVPARPVAVEALSRWSHPLTGDIGPDAFIPLAERGMFLDQLDIDVLERAARQVAAWQAAGHPLGLAVNAAPSHFSTSYAEEAIRIAARTGLDTASLTVEITETPSPQFRDSMREGLEILRAAGIGVSVDDYGASDTTIAMLVTLPISEVKLDRTLVRRTDIDAESLIEEVVSVARDQAWRIVAEGIETTDDLERSVRRGCDRGQGFLWGRPVSADIMGGVLG
jgi:EAL domain-containing protein (putative c-di-GMP-specific phosphodiesterase class I)